MEESKSNNNEIEPNDWDNNQPITPENNNPIEDERLLIKEVIKEEKEKWNRGDKINSIIASCTILAMLGSFYSAYISRESLALTKASVDSANVSSKHSDSLSIEALKLTTLSVNASIKQSELSDSNYILSKLVMEKSDSNNKKSIQIAEMTILANKQSAEFFRASAINENRSFVVAGNVSLEKYVVDSFIVITATINNIGKTPSYKTKTTLGIKIDSTEKFMNNPDLFFGNSFDTAPQINIGSNMNTSLTNLHPMNKLTDAYLQKNLLFIYVVIRSEYYDIYRIKHYYHAFSYFDMKSKTFKICKLYNDSD